MFFVDSECFENYEKFFKLSDLYFHILYFYLITNFIHKIMYFGYIQYHSVFGQKDILLLAVSLLITNNIK